MSSSFFTYLVCSRRALLCGEGTGIKSAESQMRAVLLCPPIFLAAACASVSASSGEASVLAVDEQQRAMVATGDVPGLERLAHANLRINAPGGRVLTREQFLANMRSGEIAAEAFERTAEDVSISGNIAIVMGRETFTPAGPASSAEPSAQSRSSAGTPTSTSGSTADGCGWRARRTSSPTHILSAGFG